jgi:hypothetical protein
MAATGLIVAAELWLLPLLISASLVVVLELAPLSDAVLSFSREKGHSHGDAKPAEDEGGG